MIEIDDSEKILRVVRKHWFVLLGDVIFLIVFIGLPPVLFIGAHLLPFETLLTFSGNPVFAGIFIFTAWLFVVWIIAWNMWTDYYLDVLLITDRRIFDIDQQGLFRRTSSSFRIDKIQNVTVNQKGILQTMLDFGTLQLETAGEREDFIATYISSPYAIKKFISEMQDLEEERSKLVHFETALKPEIPHIKERSNSEAGTE